MRAPTDQQRLRGAGGAGRGQRALLWSAIAIAGVLFAWRHLVGQVPSADNVALNALFDKWHLGPLRILDFAALAVLAVHFRHVLVAWARDSSIARMGRASLAVFSAHLVLCLSLPATVGDDVTARSGVVDAALLTASLMTLYAVARISLRRSKGSPGEDAKDRGAERAGGAPAAIPETAQ